MFRVVLTVAIVLHFILISCSVDGSTVHERQNCPFPGIINGDVVTANIQCNPNGRVAVDYTVDEPIHDFIVIFLELRCSNDSDGNESYTSELPFGSGSFAPTTNSISIDVYYQHGTTCSLYGCFHTERTEIHEFSNVSCRFNLDSTTTQGTYTSLGLPPSSSETVQPTTTYTATHTVSSVTPTPATLPASGFTTTPSVTRSSFGQPTQTTVLQSTSSTFSTLQAANKPPPSTDRNKMLTTIITATLFTSLVLLTCLCATLSGAIIVYNRRQKRLRVRKHGYFGHRYDATLDPNFNPVDVHPSTTVRVAQSLHSILETLKASSLSLKQHGGPDEMGFDDEKSEILQSQSSDECVSSHSVVLSMGEYNNDISDSTVESNSCENNDRCQVQDSAHALDRNLKSPDASQGSGYIHEHGSSFNHFNETSSPSSYFQSSSPIGQSMAQNSSSKFSIPLKPIVFPSGYVERYMRGQSDVSDTSSCSVGLVSNATSSSGYASNSPASDSAFGGFLSQTFSSNYRLTTSVATSSIGYVTESSGSDSPQKDLLGYLAHYNEEVGQPSVEQRMAQTNPVFDCIQDSEENEENHSPNQLQDEQTFLKYSKEYTKDSTHTSGTGYVTMPDELCIESRLHTFSDCDGKQNGIMLDSTVDVSSCDGEDTLVMNGVHTELDKNNLDVSSMCSLSLNPLHFQPISLECDSDYCDSM